MTPISYSKLSTIPAIGPSGGVALWTVITKEQKKIYFRFQQYSMICMYGANSCDLNIFQSQIPFIHQLNPKELSRLPTQEEKDKYTLSSISQCASNQQYNSPDIPQLQISKEEETFSNTMLNLPSHQHLNNLQCNTASTSFTYTSQLHSRSFPVWDL